MIKNVVFAIPPNTHPLDIAGPIQMFYECIENGADIVLHYVSLTSDTTVNTSISLSFGNLKPFNEMSLSSGDFVFIPGFRLSLMDLPDFEQQFRSFLDWTVSQYNQGATICSVCTGAFLLAATGLLDGKKATTHWKSFDRFKSRFPGIHLEENCLFVENERLFSSAGMTSGIDLCLHLIERELGHKIALEIAKQVVIYFRRGETDPQLSVFLQYRNHLDTRIHDAQDFILNHLSSSFNIDDIADHVHMSSRNLTRLFKKITNVTIGEYIEKLRAEHASQLIREGYKTDFVANQIGLKSTNQLRTLLKKHQKSLPGTST